MRLKFADCVLDLRARQLERQGNSVPLEPKVYELLEVLIKRRPAVVTNNELDELLWPQVYVARTSLTRLVSELRSALGDTPQGSQIIRTVYKTGYAFCAEVTALRSEAFSPAAIELVWRKQTFSLTDGEHLAGRDAECSIVIDAGSVSRRHARITVVAGAATIEDLDSTNGTHVNGTRISGCTPLAPGDALSLGSEALQVRRRTPSTLTVKVDVDGDKRGGDRLPKK
jgi:DNA-binding winged helix-turn-helix (wHTH) protein